MQAMAADSQSQVKSAIALEKAINSGIQSIGPFHRNLMNLVDDLKERRKSQDPEETINCPELMKKIILQQSVRLNMDYMFFLLHSLVVSSTMFPKVLSSMNLTETVPLTLFV